MEAWSAALVLWIKATAPFAPAAVIAAVLSAFLPRRDGVSVFGNVIAAFLGAPLVGMLILEYQPTYKTTAQALAVAFGVSMYWLLSQVPVVATMVAGRFLKWKK